MMPGHAPADQPAFLVWAAAGFGAELVRLNTIDAPHDQSPGKRPLDDEWQSIQVTAEHATRWAREPGNVGVRTRRFPAVDIDVDDGPIADVCEKVLSAVLGHTARRTRSNAARRALLYRLSGEPFRKQILRFKLPSGVFAKVEILADGQQLAVAGLHVSGVPNDWPAGQPNASALAPVTLDLVEAGLMLLRARLKTLGCAFEEKNGAPAPQRPRGPYRSDWERDGEIAEEALSRLDAGCGYEEWLAIGMALHSKDAESGGRAFDLWDSWSAHSDKYPGRDALEKKWATFKVGGGVNFGTLVAKSGVSAARHANGAARQGVQQPTPAQRTTPGPNARPDASGEPEPTPPADLVEDSKEIPLIRACDAIERPVTWLIENFLARGELTDLSGDPGVGKGGITASWAAAVTKASPTATVIMLATEDPLGRVRSRLRAEGADLERVWFLDIERPNASPILPGDIAQVERAVVRLGASLLILDPALEFMQSDLDSHKQQDVAAFMRPLLGIALRTQVAVLTVRHNNKNAGASALHRAAGSIAFTGTARIALTAAKNNETGERALAVTKNNLSGDKHTVGFDIVARDGASVVTWGDVLNTTADELVNQEPKRRGPAPEKLEAASDLLRSILSGGQFMTVDDILRCAKAEGVSRSRMYIAKSHVRVRNGTLNGRSAWALLADEVEG